MAGLAIAALVLPARPKLRCATPGFVLMDAFLSY